MAGPGSPFGSMGIEAQEASKREVAEAAVREVDPNQPLALGSGSTVLWVARALAQRFATSPPPRLVVASRGVEEVCRQLSLPLTSLEEVQEFALMLDGADEVDPALDLIKGGGGALFREKILARMSRELLILVDATKRVPRLGARHPLPVEVVPFARPFVQRRMEALGLPSVVRSRPGSSQPFRTDNGNVILDAPLPAKPFDARELDRALHAIPGVVETGFFLGMATRVLVAGAPGRVEELARS